MGEEWLEVGRGKILRELALKIYGPKKAFKLWKRIEFIGDIAVIRCPLNVNPEELKPLAESILARFSTVKSVWAGLPGVEGTYRLRRHIHLAGEPRSETVYKEHGCVFKVDINKAYVSPALNYEHKRIAKQVKQGETVVNMFAGVGLFSIIIAKYSKPERVHSIDINPYAFEYMVENIRLNKVENIVVPYLGDAKEVVEKHLLSTADRVLMPYPELALEYLGTGVKALRQQTGWIHVYLHVKSLRGKNPLEEAEQAVAKAVTNTGVGKFVIENSRIVRNVGPRLVQVVVDLHIP
jgi:tRNA (guanine37-N1)-methyltransferase